MADNAQAKEERRFVILLSGKRRSGKDFVANRLTKIIENRLGDTPVQLRIAESLKRRFAEIHGIDGDKLMGTSEYKDKYRAKMIEWSENERKTSGDLDQFCRAACDAALKSEKQSKVWIVVDCRRHFEVNYFLLENSEGHQRGRLTAGALTVRIVASDDTRKTRGWSFIKGADDIDSECGLDDWPKWDFTIDNDMSSTEAVDQQLTPIVDLVCKNLTST